MTKKQLIETLTDPAKRIPDDAVIKAFDGDLGDMRPVTGLLYGGNTVELCTDTDELPGTEEGEICNRGDCDGVMKFPEVENCSCHIAPPCGQCVNNRVTCLKCGFEVE